MTLIQLSKQELADDIEKYIDKRFKALMGESEAAHRDPNVAEMYMLEAWKYKNIGSEIVDWLRRS